MYLSYLTIISLCFIVSKYFFIKNSWRPVRGQTDNLGPVIRAVSFSCVHSLILFMFLLVIGV